MRLIVLEARRDAAGIMDADVAQGKTSPTTSSGR
jgi:hypothetical protein